jgi:hypothetical protein
VKNESNTGNSQRAIARICAFAFGSIILATSLPAGAVSKKLESGYGDPGNSLTWSTPSAVGAIPSNSTAYINVNAINVFAVLPNGNPDWVYLQSLRVDWWILTYDFTQQRWTTFAWTNNGDHQGGDWVYTLGSVRPPLTLPVQHFHVAPGYFYGIQMRVSWINPINGKQIAAAEYFFDKTTDLQCVAGTSKCYSYTGFYANSPSSSLQYLYFSY